MEDLISVLNYAYFIIHLDKLNFSRCADILDLLPVSKHHASLAMASTLMLGATKCHLLQIKFLFKDLISSKQQRQKKKQLNTIDLIENDEREVIKNVIEALERPQADNHDDDGAAQVRDLANRCIHADLITIREFDTIWRPDLEDQGFGCLTDGLDNDFGALLAEGALFPPSDRTVQSPNREFTMPGAPPHLRGPRRKDDETNMVESDDEIHVPVGRAIALGHDFEGMDETMAAEPFQPEVAEPETEAAKDREEPMELDQQGGLFDDADFGLAERVPSGPEVVAVQDEDILMQDPVVNEDDGGETVVRDEDQPQPLKKPRNKKPVTIGGDGPTRRKKLKIDTKVELDRETVMYNLEHYEELQGSVRQPIKQSDPMLKPFRSIKCSALMQNWAEISAPIDRHFDFNFDTETGIRADESEMRGASFVAPEINNSSIERLDVSRMPESNQKAEDSMLRLPEMVENDQGEGLFEGNEDPLDELQQPPPVLDESVRQVAGDPEPYFDDPVSHEMVRDPPSDEITEQEEIVQGQIRFNVFNLAAP